MEYCAYDMFVAASKHHAVFSSVPMTFPPQKSGQMASGPLSYPGVFCYSPLGHPFAGFNEVRQAYFVDRVYEGEHQGRVAV